MVAWYLIIWARGICSKVARLYQHYLARYMNVVENLSWDGIEMVYENGQLLMQ